MCALANFHLKVKLLWNFHRIYQDVQIYYLCPFPFHTFLFYFILFYFWVNDLNLCGRLHCIVIDYKYLLHGLVVDSNYHNWVLSEFSYKHSLSFCCVHVCIFFVLITISVGLLRKCRDIIHMISFGFLFSMFGIQASLYSCVG